MAKRTKGKSKKLKEKKLEKKVDKKITKKAAKKSKKQAKIAMKAPPQAAAKPKKTAKKINPFANFRNKLSSILLIIIGLLIVLFVGAFFVKKALEPTKLAKVLPYEETILMAEMDLGKIIFKKDRILSIPDKLSPSRWIATIEETLGVDFDTQIKPWLGLKHGFAILNIKDAEGMESYESVVFVQSTDRDATLEFLQSFKLESHQDVLVNKKYKNHTIYSFQVGQNIHFLVLDKYFVFANSEDALKKIVDVRIGESKALIQSDEYNKVRNNLKKDLGFIYYVPAELFDYYIGDNPTSSSSLIRPILALFESQGHSIILNDEALIIQTYMNFATGGADEKTLSRITKHYNADLLPLMPENFEYFWGSRNLGKVVQDFARVLNRFHPSSFNILEGALNAKKEQYLGFEVDLREDIYKVFENEFALALYTKPDHIDYLFMANGQNEDHIAKLQAYYLDTMTEQGYEVIPEGLIDEAVDVREVPIAVFPFDARTNLYTAFNNGQFVVSTSRELIEEVTQGEKLSSPIETGPMVSKEISISHYLKGFDEVNIMSPAFISELVGEKYSSYLKNFSRIQAAKSIFLDGIAIVHVFEF